MSLHGQAGFDDRGYAMAALLVAISIMAIMMSVAMPVWRHNEQREKEAELVFRGNQYVRAIRLFQAKTGTFPTSVDALVQGRFLRQKYLDPVTNGEFTYIGAGSPVAAGTPATGQRGAGAPATTQLATGPNGTNISMTAAPGAASGQPTGGFAMPASASSVPGGLIGVQSKSTDESVMVYNGRDHYNEWVFLYVSQNPGGGVGIGRGGQGTQVGSPGRPGGDGGRGGRGGRSGRGGPNGRGGPGGNPFPFPGGPGRGPGGL
jgi:type II secretory pathway pseudopilin PulG